MDTTPIDRLLDDLARLEPEQLRRMRQAWDESDPSIRQEAWRVGQEALRAAGRRAELDRARKAVSDWANDTSPIITQVYFGASRERDRVDARLAGLPAVLDAALAMLATDALDQDQRYALTRPWRAGIVGDQSRPRRRSGAGRSSPPR